MRELPPAIVGLPVGIGGFFFDDSFWYYFSAYIQEGGGRWTHLYSRGPVWLTESAAQEEFFSTVERFWGRTIFMWKWTGTFWETEKIL